MIDMIVEIFSEIPRAISGAWEAFLGFYSFTSLSEIFRLIVSGENSAVTLSVVTILVVLCMPLIVVRGSSGIVPFSYKSFLLWFGLVAMIPFAIMGVRTSETEAEAISVDAQAGTNILPVSTSVPEVVEAAE